MKSSVCVNGQCQNTMKDYICVCNAGFRSDPTKKLCNGKNVINTTGMAKAKKTKQNKTSAGFRLNYARVTKGCLWGWPKIGAQKGNDFLSAQGHPATVRGSKYCLEISKALEKLKTSGQPFLSSKKFGGFPTV